jgi:hypothetical protein
VETYEWLPGEFFLVHRFEGHVGDGAAGCIEIIGYDAQSQSYRTHTFYNNGLANEWRSHERDGTWTLAGDWHMQGKPVKVRCTTAFSDAGHTMRSTWQQSSDGSSWETFWRPMEGLAEWKLENGGWIQVFQDKDRAGSSSVTFLVSGLDDQLAELKAKGISIERTTTSDYVQH